ncbi:choice-of-anchor A family protein [Pseudoalteromonas sp. MMG010]|uniref:choice-of-anchor A family protein n=1 Tax=Pseudoalteromonas sp. MMG010 TaxID=2822685 RepID=UPI001B3A55DD|nr:choice-of-anchor A family protein [Pseudoalteromonas sp. MMG010]MBQ4834136.1 choice-of-anchor A family protein [Pseudoalteromonas sp. MMG010]
MKLVSKYKKVSMFVALSCMSSSVFAADLGTANGLSALAFDKFHAFSGSATGPIVAGEVDLFWYQLGKNRASAPDDYYLISEEYIKYTFGRQFVGSMIAADHEYVSAKVKRKMEAGAGVLQNVTSDDLPVDFDQLENRYNEMSDQLASLSPTGTVKNSWFKTYLTGDGVSNTQVFNVSEHNFYWTHKFKVSGIPADATVIINVTGGPKMWSVLKDLSALKPFSSKTIFNFPDAQKLEIKLTNWEGVILAPKTDVSTWLGKASRAVISERFYGSMSLLAGEFDGYLPIDLPQEKLKLKEKWSWTQTTFKPDSVQVTATPVVAQLNDDNEDGFINNDDIADVIFVSYKGHDINRTGTLRALNGANGTELWNYTNGGISADAYFSPVVADVDGDGIVEIFAFDNTAKVLNVVSPRGALIKQFTPDPSLALSIGNISIADIDSDGVAELIVGQSVFNYDTGNSFELAQWSPTSVVFDANDDGQQEILANGKLHDINGVVLWEYPHGSEHAWFSSVVNLDEDRFPEVVISIPAHSTTKEQHRLAVLEHNGNVKWELSKLENTGGGAQAVSTFLGPNQLGIVYAGYQAVDMHDTDGNLVWSVANDDHNSGKIGLSAFDFNGDGIDEVIIQSNTEVRILDAADGTVLATVANSSNTLWESPIVADLEGDNNAELIVVANDFNTLLTPINHGVRAYESASQFQKWMNATRVWNQASYHQTNIEQSGKLPQVELKSWLHNNSYRSSTLK